MCLFTAQLYNLASQPASKPAKYYDHLRTEFSFCTCSRYILCSQGLLQLIPCVRCVRACLPAVRKLPCMQLLLVVYENIRKYAATEHRTEETAGMQTLNVQAKKSGTNHMCVMILVPTPTATASTMLRRACCKS